MQRFRDSMIIHAPASRVFEFYTNLKNLERMIPPMMRMRVIKAQTPLRRGALVTFGLRPTGIPFEVKWVSRIIEFEPGRVFADKQIRGPFDHWLHRHEFRELEDGRTEIRDTIEVGTPMGFFGQMVENAILGQGINSLFDHRRRILRRELEDAASRKP